MYKLKTYKGQKEDKWPVKKILSHDKIDGQMFYKVKQDSYNKIIWESKENLKYAKEKIQEYYCYLDWAVLKKTKSLIEGN